MMDLFAEGSALGGVHTILTELFPLDTEYSVSLLFTLWSGFSLLFAFCVTPLPAIVLGKHISTFGPRRAVTVSFCLWSMSILLVDGLAGNNRELYPYTERISDMALVVGAAVASGLWLGMWLSEVSKMHLADLKFKRLISSKINRPASSEGEAQ